MDLLSAKEAAAMWGISPRRVAILCSENRIPNAKIIGNSWVIPSDAIKPLDERHIKHQNTDERQIKPFLKWAGGKGQLLNQIENYYPFEKGITKYAEPFVGGGAVLFDILNKFELDEIYISDINLELTNTYKAIRNEVNELIETLATMQEEFIPLDDEIRRSYYLEKRNKFNSIEIAHSKDISVEKAALMIFLNKTCFNGLYRVNKKGLFNVPMGAYKNPLICDENNLKEVSKKLKNVRINCSDYKKSDEFIDQNTFVYFDPPYRPLSETSNFTSYTENTFDDNSQIELANYVKYLGNKGAKVLVSNSDPKNTNENDNFFDEIYSGCNIERVSATRMINRNASSRGKIKELIISNF